MADDQTALNEIERHFWLTRSVARMTGVNLSVAMALGQLTADDYAEMVARCRAGNCSANCERWLARQTPDSADPPAHCHHAGILKRLQPMQREHH